MGYCYIYHVSKRLSRPDLLVSIERGTFAHVAYGDDNIVRIASCVRNVFSIDDYFSYITLNFDMLVKPTSVGRSNTMVSRVDLDRGYCLDKFEERVTFLHRVVIKVKYVGKVVYLPFRPCSETFQKLKYSPNGIRTMAEYYMKVTNLLIDSMGTNSFSWVVLRDILDCVEPGEALGHFLDPARRFWEEKKWRVDLSKEDGADVFDIVHNQHMMLQKMLEPPVRPVTDGRVVSRFPDNWAIRLRSE